MAASYQSLELRRGEDGVAELLLNNGRGNPFNATLWSELPAAFAELDDDAAVRCVLLRTEGPAFSFGLDLQAAGASLMPALSAGLSGRNQIRRLGDEMRAAFDAPVRSPKPVVAAINGWCVGAGVDLIAGCDLRLCSADARFSVREVKVGMVADMGSIQRLPAIIGEGNTRYLALSGCDIDAARAQAMGLVLEVAADSATLVERARALAAEIAANPPHVLAGIKQVMNARIEPQAQVGLREALALNTSLMQSEDFREAVTAFFQKRAPRFSGR